MLVATRTASSRRAHYLRGYGRERPGETAFRTAVSARFMVRMGSPVRFRRGALPQTSSSGRVQHPACRLPESCWTPFARGLPARFVRLASWWHLPLRRGDHGWPLDWRRVERQREPHHSSAGADDHGVPRDLPEQAVARRWCEARHEEDIGYRSAPGGIDADPTSSEEGTAPSMLSLRLGAGLQSWPVTSEMGP
jgi:hypothetical protein